MGTAGDGSMDTSECFGPSGSGGGVHTAIASSSFGDAMAAVSYTHLTLPTTLSV